MKSIICKQFLDQTWASDDLEKAAQCWLLIHEDLAKERKVDYTPTLIVEMELTGFSKYDGDALRTELERRVSSSRMPRFTVSLPDPDTLVLTSSEIGFDQTSLLNLVLSVLSGPLFEGLAIEIRFSLVEARRLTRGNRGSLPSNLIVLAQLNQERLSVKTAMRDFPDGINHATFHHRTWKPDDELVQNVLLEFMETEEVSPQSLHKLFKSKAMAYPLRWLQWLILVPINRPRLTALTLRWVLFAALFVCLDLAIEHVKDNHDFSLLFIPLTCIGIIILLLFLLFMFVECSLLLYFFKFRLIFRDCFSDLERYTILKSAESKDLNSDPMVRKHTTELTARGFSHIGDTAKTPLKDAKAILRVFLAPDKISYLTLSCSQVLLDNDPKKRFKLWPVQIVFRAQTFFSHGGRVDSIGPSIYSFWLPKVGHDTLIRVTRAFTDPLEFFQSHREATEQFAVERALTPVPHKRIEDYVSFRENNFEEERQYFLDHPYSWLNHLRFYLQWPRQESRG